MHQQINIYQHQHQFPNFTHPPPPLELSLPSIDDATIERFLIDRNHLAVRQTTGEPNIVNHFKLNGRERLNVAQTNLTNLIRQQQIDETNLENNVAQLTPVRWQDKINSLKQNQIKIAKLLTKFEALSSALARTTIAKKRKIKRKTRKAQHSIQQKLTDKKVAEEEESATKPPKFEDNLEQSYEKYELERLRTANLKRSSECKRQLALLDSLVELRCIRRKNSNASGSDRQLSSEKSFIEQIDQLKSKWNEALAECNSQENKLQLLLTSTGSQLWSNALFSNTSDSPFIDNSADFQTLLNIRKSWDLCLVTDANAFGSSIPPGWVLPNSTPSAEWMPFLVK